jgi:hypothetical protein
MERIMASFRDDPGSNLGRGQYVLLELARFVILLQNTNQLEKKKLASGSYIFKV